MSKSYKKYPKVKQEGLTKKDKHFLNKRLRHLYQAECFSGSEYKKLLNNWNTWQYRWTWKDALEQYNTSTYFQSTYPKIADFRNYYETSILRK